jgi:hypothetical protein
LSDVFFAPDEQFFSNVFSSPNVQIVQLACRITIRDTPGRAMFAYAAMNDCDSEEEWRG